MAILEVHDRQECVIEEVLDYDGEQCVVEKVVVLEVHLDLSA